MLLNLLRGLISNIGYNLFIKTLGNRHKQYFKWLLVLPPNSEEYFKIQLMKISNDSVLSAPLPVHLRDNDCPCLPHEPFFGPGQSPFIGVQWGQHKTHTQTTPCTSFIPHGINDTGTVQELFADLSASGWISPRIKVKAAWCSINQSHISARNGEENVIDCGTPINSFPNTAFTASHKAYPPCIWSGVSSAKVAKENCIRTSGLHYSALQHPLFKLYSQREANTGFDGGVAVRLL